MVADVFLPIKQCVEIIGSGMQPDVASGIIKQCLKGMQCKVRSNLHRFQCTLPTLLPKLVPSVRAMSGVLTARFSVVQKAPCNILTLH